MSLASVGRQQIYDIHIPELYVALSERHISVFIIGSDDNYHIEKNGDESNAQQSIIQERYRNHQHSIQYIISESSTHSHHVLAHSKYNIIVINK